MTEGEHREGEPSPSAALSSDTAPTRPDADHPRRPDARRAPGAGPPPPREGASANGEGAEDTVLEPDPTVTLPAPPAPEPDRGDALAVVFFLTLFITSIISIGWLFRGFWTDIILALVFAALSRGLYARVVQWTRRPYVAATLVCALIVILVAIPTVFLIISLSAEAANAIELTRSSVSLDRLEELMFGEGWLADNVRKLSELSGIEITPRSVKNLVSGAAGAVAQLVYEGVNDLLTNVLSGIFHFLILIAVVFYLLVDGERFRTFVFRLSPLPTAHEELLLDKFGDVGRAILFGNGIGSAIQGVLGGMAMAAVGLPSSVLWGTVMTIFAFLPLVGITFVVIPATAYLALTGKYLSAVGFFVFCGLMALIVENVVKTRLMGSHMQMHDLLIFLSVIGGLAMFGLLGILYGPLLVTLFLTLAQLYETGYKDRIQDPLERSLQPPSSAKP
jgi:predicted PurR-regulated permease PerM